MNLRTFKLHRVYLDPLNLWNVGGFCLRLILKDFHHLQKKKGKFVVACSLTSSLKRRIGRFHIVVVQWTSN